MFDSQWALTALGTAFEVSLSIRAYLAEVVENPGTNQLFLARLSAATFARRLPSQRLVLSKVMN